MGFLKSYFILLSSLTSAQLDSLKDILEKAELEIYLDEKQASINPRFKLHYHVTPPCGWMNIPSGLLFYNREYHLFYQYYPYDIQWGPMHWGHVASPNLVDWRHMPIALRPGSEQCFSGSAINNADIMILMYTGHQPTNVEPYYNATQNLAFSVDGVLFNKYQANPVLINPPAGTQIFRDPKIWRHEPNWYVVLGGQTEDNRGSAILYKSTDMIKWEFACVLAESNGHLGYMWEAPDFFELRGKFILLISPQGMISRGDRFKNTFQTGYIIGNFDYDTNQFQPEVGFQEMDYGHDFYATQTTFKNGRRFLIAWFGMWESTHPEDTDGWVGAMTIVRELDLVGDRILMKPVDSITQLRMETIIEGEFHINSCIEFEQTGEIIVNIDLGENIELEFKGASGGDKTSLRWDMEVGKIVVDRAGDVRQVAWEPIRTVTWRIFLDASSLELFCGEGEVVFSSRIYPNGEWRVINRGPQSLHVVAYTLRKMRQKRKWE